MCFGKWFLKVKITFFEKKPQTYFKQFSDAFPMDKLIASQPSLLLVSFISANFLFNQTKIINMHYFLQIIWQISYVEYSSMAKLVSTTCNEVVTC